MNEETRTPNPLLSRLGAALEFAINRAVALDAGTREKIAKLDGRRIGVELKPLDLALAITVDHDRLRVGPHWDRDRDLNLRASPASLLAFAMRRGDDSMLPPGKVDISGDAELARQFEKIVRDFRPDFEEAFAQTFGDVLGVPIARVVGSAFAWTRDSAKSITLDAVEFVRDESRDAVASPEAEKFYDEVDDLRERADRLEARIRRLGDAR
ncbi:MAG TPA: SCP2 sterol-binding domain-containing protein [Rudaea sp.]|nr:SCP2 sterol-binding domain-containing protein [Rudaea sp.]